MIAFCVWATVELKAEGDTIGRETSLTCFYTIGLIGGALNVAFILIQVLTSSYTKFAFNARMASRLYTQTLQKTVRNSGVKQTTTSVSREKESSGSSMKTSLEFS